MRSHYKRLNESFDDYLIAALWSSSTGDGTPLDRDHDIGDFARDAENELQREYDDFLKKFGDELDALGGMAHQMAAHDLWLTQNGHGAGFWDRKESLYGKGLQDRMDKYASRAGEIFLYVGNDGKIHT